MGTAWNKYMRQPQTMIAVVVALMAQLIFCTVWMTAYDGVWDRIDRLPVAIVNEDGAAGERLEESLRAALPYRAVSASKEQALRLLDQRAVHLIVTIPEGFHRDPGATGQAEKADQASKLHYTMNASNPQMTVSIMKAGVEQMTAQLNRQAAADIEMIHPVKGMNNQMIPMMLVLASYVGAMLMAMNLHQASQAIAGSIARWQHVGAGTAVTASAAALIAAVGTGLIVAFGGQMQGGIISFALFHFLTILTFMVFAQMFVALFGMAGMLMNMAVLSLQLVTSGTVVPRELLGDVYQWIGQLLPATYAVEGYLNLLFGGAGTEKAAGALGVILLAGVLLVSIVPKGKRQDETREEARQLA